MKKRSYRHHAATTAALWCLVFSPLPIDCSFAKKVDPVPQVQSDQATVLLLERIIPLTIQVHTAPKNNCDPLEVELLIQTDAAGRELGYRWRAMDQETVLLECSDFDDLYYRCEAPSCLRIRVLTQNETGRTVAERKGHLCIE